MTIKIIGCFMALIGGAFLIIGTLTKLGIFLGLGVGIFVGLIIHLILSTKESKNE